VGCASSELQLVGTSICVCRCRRSRPDSVASASDPAHPPQRAGESTTTRSGSSTSDRDDPSAPGCLPGLRPDRVRDERFFARVMSHGGSVDGGREEFDESAPSRRCSSAI